MTHYYLLPWVILCSTLIIIVSLKDQPASYKSKTPLPKLEGVFGPALPQVPEPTRIKFPDLEEEYSGQISYSSIATAPRTSRNTDPIVTYGVNGGGG